MEDVDFIPVLENEEGDVTELPVEDNSTVMLDTVTAQFPGASGLKYRSSETGNYRAVRCVDNVLSAPKGGWAGSTYIVVYPKGEKRKSEDDDRDGSVDKRFSKDHGSETEDLITLGLPWKWTDADLKEFFSKYGSVVFAEVKKERQTGRSKGFGFIRYETLSEQEECLSKRHESEGRYLDVKISGGAGTKSGVLSRKIFVGRVSPDVNEEDVKKYFEKYGEITDCFMPKPHRGFAFVTFLKSNIVHKLYGSHTINGYKVEVVSAAPKKDAQVGGPPMGRGGGYGGYGGYGGGGSYDSYVGAYGVRDSRESHYDRYHYTRDRDARGSRDSRERERGGRSYGRSYY